MILDALSTKASGIGGNLYVGICYAFRICCCGIYFLVDPGMLSSMYPVLVGLVCCSSVLMPKVVEVNPENCCCGAECWGSYYVPCLGVGFFLEFAC